MSARRSSSPRVAKRGRPRPISFGSRAPPTSDLSEQRLREILLTETMPELARAFRGSFDRVHVTQTNGSDPLAFVSAGMDHVLAALGERKRA